jgi:hypothetical protein
MEMCCKNGTEGILCKQNVVEFSRMELARDHKIGLEAAMSISARFRGKKSSACCVLHFESCLQLPAMPRLLC